MTADFDRLRFLAEHAWRLYEKAVVKYIAFRSEADPAHFYLLEKACWEAADVFLRAAEKREADHTASKAVEKAASRIVLQNGHVQHECQRPDSCGDDRGDCNACALSWCGVCGGAEASLPTACPAFLLTASIEQAIQDGAIDYIPLGGGAWVVLRTLTPEEMTAYEKARRLSRAVD